MAAQSLVRYSYEVPKLTMQTNILGTINVLEAVRESDSVKSLVIVTSDKCYENHEQVWGYKETDPLGGEDPYSASKAATEIVFRAYLKSFFSHKEKLGTVSVRAGNVIGGGDWAKDRIVTDAIKALENKQEIPVRNPHAVRPWQFVLEPLHGYLILGEKLYNDKYTFGSWNFGPDTGLMITVKELIELLIKKYGSGSWKNLYNENENKKESVLLSLDCTKAKHELKWEPLLTPEQTMQFIVDWYKNYKTTNVYELSKKQIDDFVRLKDS